MRAPAMNDRLSLKLGQRKYGVPVEARILRAGDFTFLHIPISAVLLQSTADGLQLVDDPIIGEQAVQAFRNLRKQPKKSAAQLPQEILDALKKIPHGYKLGYTADGSPRLVKKRGQ
jgi:hypothetical protein